MDFIVEKPDGLVPVEVKTGLHKPKVSRSFRSFLDKYTPRQGIVASNQLNAETEIDAAQVSFLPHWGVVNCLSQK